MTDPIVGIDLGTTNTVVATCDDGGNPRVLADGAGVKIHPSVVAFHPNGSVIVGAEAKQRKVIDPRNTVYSAKRLIGRAYRSREIQAAQQRVPYVIKEGVNQQPVIQTRGGEFAVPEISAIILDHVRNVAQKALGTSVSRAVITVPASFNDAQRSATATAGAIAGLTVVRVLNEPTAAALAYGHQKQLSRTIAVYDFGGGTFDVTVLRLDDQVYEVLGTAGDSFLGGDDLDERLVDHMVSTFLAKHRVDLRENEVSIMRLRAVAEQTKIELSRRTRAIVKVDEVAFGPGGAPLHLEIEVTRDELISRIGDIVERTFPVCEEALRVAGVGVGDVEEVVLVGGTTKIPHVRDRVTRFFGKVPRTDVNPEEAVAVGAALQAAALERLLQSKRQTARSTTPPPGTPMSRPATDAAPAPSSGAVRTTAPRIAPEPRPTAAGAAIDPTRADAEEPTDVRPGAQIRRTTAPLGVPQTTRPGTERPHARGAQIDRFDGGGTGAGTNPGTGAQTTPGTNPGAVPLGRITRPAAAPPPVPARTAEPAVPTASPSAKTLFGVPAAPLPTGSTRPAPDGVDFDDLVTGAGTGHSAFELPATSPNFDLPATSPNFDLPATSPVNLAIPPEAYRPGAGPPPVTGPLPMPAPAAATAPTMMIGGPPAITPPPMSARAAQQPTMIGPAPIIPTAPAPLGAPIIPTAPAPRAAAPVVLDVTPASFGIGTVAGYCEELIRRNARVPTEMKRLFVTSHDRQQVVRIRVCQGESRRLDENVLLGDLVLDGLEARPRGETQIEVTFSLDASGILQVRARDARTGREQRATLEVMGRQSPEELAAAQGRLAQLRR